MIATIIYGFVFVVSAMFVFNTVKIQVTDYLISNAKKRKYAKHGLSTYKPDSKDRKAKLTSAYAVMY